MINNYNKYYFKKNIVFAGDILFYIVLFLSIFGCIMIFSTTSATNNYIFLKKQIIALGVGIFLFLIVSNLNHNIFISLTYPFMVLNFILLLAVFYFPARNGAYRWISIPFIGNFQPTELARLIFVLFISKFIDLYRSKIINYKKELFILLVITTLFCFLIFLQPDMGVPLIIIFNLLIILFLISNKLIFVLKIFFFFFLIFFIGFISKPYRIQRVKAMLDPWKFQSKIGYQLVQSYLSLSRGYLLGCGLGNGIFKEYYLPEAHTDFIFCMIGEEVGFIGTFGIVLIYAFICFLGLSMSKDCLLKFNNFYSSLLILGLTFNIVLQAYISIAMTIGLFPTKGIGLPFISYGGSSLIVNFLSVGIMVNFWKKSK